MNILLLIPITENWFHSVFFTFLTYYGLMFVITVVCLRWYKGFLLKLKATTGDYMPPVGKSDFDREHFPFAFELFAAMFFPFYTVIFCMRSTYLIRKWYGIGKMWVPVVLTIVIPALFLGAGFVTDLAYFSVGAIVPQLICYFIMNYWQNKKFVMPKIKSDDDL